MAARGAAAPQRGREGAAAHAGAGGTVAPTVVQLRGWPLGAGPEIGGLQGREGEEAEVDAVGCRGAEPGEPRGCGSAHTASGAAPGSGRVTRPPAAPGCGGL